MGEVIKEQREGSPVVLEPRSLKSVDTTAQDKIVQFNMYTTQVQVVLGEIQGRLASYISVNVQGGILYCLIAG